MIGYLRDAWPQYSREDVWGGEFIRSEWKSFTLHSILRFPPLDNGLPPSSGIDAPHKVTLH